MLHAHTQSRLVAHDDKRIQQLSNIRDSLIICPFPCAKKGSGYRILVNSTDNRDAAYQLKHKLQEHYPHYSVYMSYQTPYFKLKMGDFLRENEAGALNSKVSRNLRVATSIIPGIIYLPNIQKVDEQPCIEQTHLPLYGSRQLYQ